MILRDFEKMLGIVESGTEQPTISNCIAVKHTDIEPITYLLDGQDEKFEEYQSEQGGKWLSFMRNHIGGYMVSFISEGVVARFYGIYEIVGLNGNKFDLAKVPTPGKLEDRLVLKFPSGLATNLLYSSIRTPKYEVVEIRPEKKTTVFASYEDVYISFFELKRVIEDSYWKDMLSRFGGVYLILDTRTGKQYVGSASGKDGFLGRWREYAIFPSGGMESFGNIRLEKLLSGVEGNDTDLMGIDYACKFFRYSILEVLPLRKNYNQHIIEAESRWKRHLGSRKFGLNDN